MIALSVRSPASPPISSRGLDTKMTWILSDKWAVSRDPYNWILLRKTGKSWKKSYYASPEQLLKSLYRKITRTEPAQPDLLEHLEACLEVAQAFSRQFHQQTGMRPQPGNKRPTNAQKRNMG